MPHIRLRGMSTEQAGELSQSLPASLAPILETTVDNFTVELVQTQFFQQGSANSGYPFCEVLWFERSADHRQRCADWLTAEIRRLTAASDVAVVFFPIERSDYFENGKHF
jgi:hypothetical protein